MTINKKINPKKFNFVSLVLFVGLFVFLILFSVILNFIPENIWIKLVSPFINSNMSAYEINEIVQNFFFIVCQVLTLITIVFIYIKYRNDSMLEVKKPSLTKLIFIGIIFGISSIIITRITFEIYSLITNTNIVSENTEMVSEQVKKFPLTLISTLIVAPILEEINFKAGIFTFFHEIFRDKSSFFNTFIPAVIAACIFGLLHDGISLIPIYFIPSFLGCILYKKTGSLIPCMVAHFINNFFVAILLFIK